MTSLLCLAILSAQFGPAQQVALREPVLPAYSWPVVKGLKPVSVTRAGREHVHGRHPITWTFELQRPYKVLTPEVGFGGDRSENGVRSNMHIRPGRNQPPVDEDTWVTIVVIERPESLWSLPKTWPREAVTAQRRDPKPPVPMLRGLLPASEYPWFAAAATGTDYAYVLKRRPDEVREQLGKELSAGWTYSDDRIEMGPRGLPVYVRTEQAGPPYRKWRVSVAGGPTPTDAVLYVQESLLLNPHR